MENLFVEKITNWCNESKMVLKNQKSLTSVALTLKDIDKTVKNKEDAAKEIGQVLEQEIKPEEILAIIPLCKDHPGPDWKLGTAFAYPYQDLGWIVIFEKSLSLSFLDRNMFYLVDKTYYLEERDTFLRQGSRLGFQLGLTLIAIIIFAIIVYFAK